MGPLIKRSITRVQVPESNWSIVFDHEQFDSYVTLGLYWGDKDHTNYAVDVPLDELRALLAAMETGSAG